MSRKNVRNLDREKIEQLAAIGCTIPEIAAEMDTSHDTLERYYLATVHKGKEKMKASIRRMQYKAAQDGSVAAMIWLGKNYLGQSDKAETIMTVRDYEIDIGGAPDSTAQQPFIN